MGIYKVHDRDFREWTPPEGEEVINHRTLAQSSHVGNLHIIHTRTVEISAPEPTPEAPSVIITNPVIAHGYNEDYSLDDLKEMTRKELIALSKMSGIQVTKKAKKSELISVIASKLEITT